MDGIQLEQLQKALLSAFPRRSDLEQLLLFEFNERLQNIAGGNNQAELVLSLLEWAERNGKLDELAQKAHKRVPGNPLLAAYVNQYLKAAAPGPQPPPMNLDINRLIQIVASQPQITNPSARYNFVRQLLLASRDANKVIGGIDLEGGANTAATAIIFGIMGQEESPLDYAQGRYYILDALNQLLELVPGESNRAFLRQTAQEIASHVGISASSPLPTTSLEIPPGSWTGQEETPNEEMPNAEGLFNEKVIDENTLRPIYYLSLGLTAAEAVCKISYPQTPGSAVKLAGTGFLITPRHILTNHHVIGRNDILAETEVRFHYERLSNGAEREVIKVRPKAGTDIIADPSLDISLFELDDAGAELLKNAGIAPLTVSTLPVEINNRVAIIQHPGGEYKQISLQNNKVQGVGDNFMDYTTTTLPGSSGSPVLDNGFRVVGIHRAGGDLKKPGTNLFYYRNRGTMITAVIAFLTGKGVNGFNLTNQPLAD